MHCQWENKIILSLGQAFPLSWSSSGNSFNIKTYTHKIINVQGYSLPHGLSQQTAGSSLINYRLELLCNCEKERKCHSCSVTETSSCC